MLGQSSSEEDVAIADQILAASTDTIINPANTETFETDVYERVVQCYRKIGVFLVKNLETIFKNKETPDAVMLRKIESLEKLLSAG